MDAVRLKVSFDLSACEAPDNVKRTIKILKLKLVNTIIHTNISLAVAAVLLTVSAQIQLGLKPDWHPYLFLVFVATLIKYNRHRLAILFAPDEAIHSGKHELIRKNRKKFYFAALVLGIGFVIATISTKKEVLLTFLLLGFLTLFYSGPGFGMKKSNFKLREIPYLKIFLITAVWSVSTLLLPVIQDNGEIFSTQVLLLFSERFFFIFAIAIQFDIRDTQADHRAGLKTIPLLIGQNKAIILSYLSLSAGFLVSVFHYLTQNERYILWALSISFISTLTFFKLRYFRNRCLYYYQILDATLLLQGLLVLGFYFRNGN